MRVVRSAIAVGAKMFALTLSIFIFGAAVATAAGEQPSRFGFHAGDGFGGTKGPDVTSASSGATITVSARGNFDVASHEASGGGIYYVTGAGGKLKSYGTFTATGLESWDPYGCGGHHFPSNYCGGLAVFAAHVVEHLASGETKRVSAVFTIDCLIGHPEPGAKEGVTLDLQGLDFDKPVSGDNLFVATDAP